MLKLFDFRNSVCCQKARIALSAKGLEWEEIEVDLFKSEQYDPEYLKLNPRGVVPTLVHDGRAVPESTLICEYLDETFPDPPLAPADPWARTRMRYWSKLVDEGLHEGVTEISFSAMFRERMKGMTEDQREARFRNIGDPRRRDRFKSTYELGAASPFVLYAVAASEKAFGLMEETLADGRPWLVGDTPSLADIALMPYAARLDYLGLIGVWIDDRPGIKAWWTRAQDWPAFRAGLRDRLTDPELANMAEHGPKIRDTLAGHRAGL